MFFLAFPSTENVELYGSGTIRGAQAKVHQVGCCFRVIVPDAGDNRRRIGRDRHGTDKRGRQMVPNLPVFSVDPESQIHIFARETGRI